MNVVTEGPGADLTDKIARLVEERGWNQEDFARISKLNRHTVRQILGNGPKRRLRNATVSQCADALGLTVNELRNMPLDRLLSRMHGKPSIDEDALRSFARRATLPELVSWIERNRERAAALHTEEMQELLDMQSPGGPLEKIGVENCVDLIERRRRLLCRVKEIAVTEYLELLERLVELMCEKIKYSGRKYE
jgi:transcriptional regulator with XRE-family HTH domain